MSSIRNRRNKVALAVLVVVLLVTHVVQWRPGLEPMVLGFMPWDLAYHLIWMVAAAAVIFWWTTVDWDDPSEDPP